MAEGLGHYGIELLGQFEPGPDGKPATEAYECGGGRWTLGLGATTWPNGKPIRPGDFCTPEQAIELTNWHVRRFAKVVDDTIRKPMTTNQRDAMIIMAYNIGPEAFAASSVARRFNDGDLPRHTAEAFGMWCKATNDNPDKYDLREPIYQEVIGRNADGDPIWVGPKINPPDGWKVQRIEGEFWGVDPKDETQKVPLGIRPRPYRRAYPGLLRRHLSEACLFLDLDWRQACRKETVSITATRIWDSEDRRWEDLVRKKTELPDILPLALPYPLPARPVAVGADFGAPLPNQPTPLPVDVAPVPDSARAIPDTPAAPAPVPVPEAKGGAVPAPPNPAGAVLAPSETPAAPVPKSPVAQSGRAVEESKAAPSVSSPPPVTKPVPPPVIAGVDGVKPKSPNTVPPSDVPYKIDPNAGLKPLEESDRAKGYVIQQVGIGVIRLGSLGVFGSTIQGGAQVVQGDPVLSNIILMAFVAGGIALVGYVIKTYGEWKKKRGEEKASQGLF